MVYAKRQVLEVVLVVVKTVGLKLPMVWIVPTHHIYCISVARSYSGAPTGSVLRQTPTRCRKSPRRTHGTGEGASSTSNRPPAASGIASSTPYVGTMARARAAAAISRARTARRALPPRTWGWQGKGVKPSETEEKVETECEPESEKPEAGRVLRTATRSKTVKQTE